ncbi:hypothetical protein EUGRSUZ_F00475 [Eucalyptus grandis]|uniref:Uncharacterized protein n=2 Tax=Eucalyptus grandis TaxID=71139 RepID=A0ACC3KAN9_EUCGR|nr:hypothetical protein EUGRSUZ_F00475 [Eucalyptus grandis]
MLIYFFIHDKLQYPFPVKQVGIDKMYPEPKKFPGGSSDCCSHMATGSPAPDTNHGQQDRGKIESQRG